ncbi:hypothetical protein B0H17DRAFT_1136395 [Mycena rosella]|uniref:F-box domain-containing protein n=1 Tax=Mycena rosella TaxID=1033263 RepID=A0AAD7GBZ9_MYCRO|nr:hypothetical protein B0H17DRAFT_1136395 [Mycena rosella]
MGGRRTFLVKKSLMLVIVIRFPFLTRTSESTMLSPCRRKPIAEWRPDENIIEILQAASRADQAALCRVSKLFHALPVLIYRNVHLAGYAPIEAFCSAIVSTPSLSQSVRSFKFIEWNSERDLGRDLHIRDLGHLSDLWPPTSPRIRLFQLQRLLCPARIVSGITARSLEFARLDWISEEEPNAVEAIVVALKSMTHPDVPFICAIEDCDHVFPELLASILRNIPYTKALHMCMDSNHHSRNGPTIFMARPPPRFRNQGHNRSAHSTRARRCLFDPSGVSLMGLLFLWLDLRLVLGTKDTTDQLTVRGLGDVYLTLAACRLCFSAWRKVSGAWEKYPVDELMVLSGID